MSLGPERQVSLEERDGGWELRPVGRRSGQLQRWRPYSREEIPPLFGLEFSTAIWNVGYVKRNGHMFLLTTLDKAGHGSEFQYSACGQREARSRRARARGGGPTRSENADGTADVNQDILGHAERGIPVHLFVRAQKKLPGGGSAPFVYCGDVRFVSCDGDKPITVRWRLPEAVSERLRGELKVPT